MSPDKFWSLTDQSGGPDSCWNWLGALNGADRGRVKHDGRIQYAYRVAVELVTGNPIPPHLLACHHCDNPRCVNPKHIFIGTVRDNSQDAWKKGRLSPPPPTFGIAHHAASVEGDRVAQAVMEYLAGSVSQSEIARRYGVAQTTVSKWVRAQFRPDSGVAGTTLGRGRRPGVDLKPHGTHAGYARHRRANEPACEDCLAAERAHCAQQRQKRQDRQKRLAVESQVRAA